MGKIGERLKRERERIGLSPAEFGDKCKVGKSAQYRYESGERSPDGEYLALAAEQGVDVLYVVTGERSPLSVKEERAANTDAERLAEFIAQLKLDDADAEMLKGLALRLAK